MKTVRDACQLEPNSLSVKPSDHIEQLDELITVEANGAAFFDKTFITQGMQDLITEGTEHFKRTAQETQHKAQLDAQQVQLSNVPKT
ncbi:MAG: hypothetical protein IPG77_04890 [Betaproteobacteria bacterium]|nr:hypothetical protein [Betaproteobacteria bacterium]